jgi:hypothetical protein
MTRVRLRPAHSPQTLAEIYREPHDHTRWHDHIIRVNATIELAQDLAGGPLRAVADLSCGSAAVAKALTAEEYHLGDLAPGYGYHGPLEVTAEELPKVDLFVCTETLEHLDDPDAVLRQIREKSGKLVLSTPVDAWQDNNPEHYWAWSRDDVEAMLSGAGWSVELYKELDFRPGGLTYCFGIWGCS